jgi:hypothetical protein
MSSAPPLRSVRPRRPASPAAPPPSLPPDTSRPATAGRQQALVLLVVAGVLLAVGFVWVMLVGSYSQYAAALIAGGLIVASIPIARHAARVEQWPALSGLLMLALLVRIGGSSARYAVAYGAYGGVADASTYTQVADTHYKAFRQLHLFTPDTSVFHGLIPWLDTVIYALFGPTELGAFFIFAWFNFIGTYLFYRAFRIAYPRGDGRRYAMLLFFIPSLLYWPSSLGKEAWMMLAIGLACYGLARALASRPGGYVALMAGVGGMLLVRPHLALIFLPAAFFAFVFRRSQPGRRQSGFGRIVGVVVLVVSSFVVIAKAQSYFGISTLDVQTLTQQLKTTRVQTNLGNSAFNPPNAQSPLGFPEAVVTVLFRPFPFEAHSAAVLVASLEGLVLLGFFVVSRRRLRRIFGALRESPYVLFAVAYSLLFIFAFSNFSNFGILARERVQMFPLVLVLLAIPESKPADRTEPAEPAEPAAPKQRALRTTPSGRRSTERRPLPTYRGRRRTTAR